MTPGQILDLVVVVLVGALLMWGGSKLVDGIQAPAKLDAAIGNNAALKAGSAAQNKGIDGLAAASKSKQDKGNAAVKLAGKQEGARAQAILDAKPEGDTDYERAVKRIDRELGLK